MRRLRFKLNRSKTMRIEKIKVLCVTVCAVILAGVGAAQVSAQAEMKQVPDGTKLNVLGIINTRTADTFIMTTLDGSSRYVVRLDPSTSVKSNMRGVFRPANTYAASYLLRGLRVEARGKGNAAGELAATDIRFNEQDLRTAQSLESRIDPVEQQANSNTGRLTAAEENAKRMSGQIEENAAAANAAQASANNAQATGDQALLAANRANTRINGLDEYDPIKTIVVPFATGSSTIGTKGKAIIDEAAAWVKTQNTKGWMVAVVGFADSTGKTAANKTLSERRANAVIGYLVSKHNMPLTRLVQPFGAGVDQPAATNDTAEGRAQNRRVEIRLMVNKGIAGQ
jgi:outer membrane protein OmpA-like peptidoglycan-associated protein